MKKINECAYAFAAVLLHIRDACGVSILIFWHTKHQECWAPLRNWPAHNSAHPAPATGTTTAATTCSESRGAQFQNALRNAMAVASLR